MKIKTIQGCWWLVLLMIFPFDALALQKPNKSTMKLTLDRAVQLALRNNPGLQGAAIEIDQAQAKRKQARAHFGPQLQFEMRAMRFDEPPSIGGGGTSDEELAALTILAGDDPFDNAMVKFFQELPNMFQSKDYDVTLTARVVQPLTPLWAIYQMYKLSELEVDISRIETERHKSRLVFQVQEIYLRVLQAQAGKAALEEAVKTIAAHIKRAKTFLNNGLINKNDLLQAKVRLATAQGQLLEVEHQLELARAKLAMLLNIPARQKLQLVLPPDVKKEKNTGSLRKAQTQALSNRPEMRELDLRIQQAQRGIKAAWQGYIPTISAIGQYQHNEGSVMAPPTWTAGVMVDFKVWEWGSTYYKIEEAQARLSRARVGRRELIRGIELEVRAAWLKINETQEKIQIAKTALVQAKEQLRLERERYEVQQNTSTDVLDAQTRLTQAQVSADAASIDHRIALAALDKAIGRQSWTKNKILAPKKD